MLCCTYGGLKVEEQCEPLTLGVWAPPVSGHHCEQHKHSAVATRRARTRPGAGSGCATSIQKPVTAVGCGVVG